MKLFRIRKKPSVAIVTAMTTGIKRRSERQLSSRAAKVKPLINHDQNNSDPAWLPHSPVTR